MAPTLEFVHMTVKDGQEAEFLRLRPGVERAVAARPGFIDAELVRLEDGTWIDLVHWEDHQSALAAAEAVAELPEPAAWFELIEEVQIMNHGEVLARSAGDGH